MKDPALFASRQADLYRRLLTHITSFEFEKALTLCQYYKMKPTRADLNRIIDELVKARTTEKITCFSRRFDLRVNALRRFRDTAGDPEKILEKVILPEGYNGKILLVMITGGIFTRQVCLRSGDIWHREILRNTENEIRDLGFLSSVVHELGGAHVRFEKNSDIALYGTSDDFGSCDKVYASNLIRQVFKERNITIME